MIKIAVKVQLKKEVLDTRGRAILKLLQKENPLVKDCRYGKYIELTFAEKDPKKALKSAESMAKNILSHSLIENFKLELINDGALKGKVC